MGKKLIKKKDKKKAKQTRHRCKMPITKVTFKKRAKELQVQCKEIQALEAREIQP